jgi:hypothetical protein
VTGSFRVAVGGVERNCITEGEATLPAVLPLHALSEASSDWIEVLEA